MPKKKESGDDVTAGWQEAIRKAGEDSRNREQERLVEVAKFRQDLRHGGHTFPDFIRKLLRAHDEEGLIRTNELLDELRYVAANL